MTKAFRPQCWSGKYKLKHPRVSLYHWMERRNCADHVYRVGGQLHYLAHHAPVNLQKKWRKAADKFEQRYPKKV